MAAFPGKPLTPSSTEGGLEPGPTAVAWYTLGVLAVAHMLSLLDRKLPLILAQSIKTDLQLNDTQLGLVIGVMFAIVYTTVAIPMGALADRTSRKRLIAGAITIWSVMTAAGGLAQNVWQLGLSRMGVAVGESVCTPAASSMIGDMFAPRFRARAVAIYFVGAQMGILAGLVLGGWINEIANWRMALILLGAPGVLLALVIGFTIREPARMNRENTSPTEPRPKTSEVALQLLRQPTLVHLIFAAALAALATGGLQAFLPAYIIRTYDMGSAQVGFTYGVAMGLSGLAGVLFGGFAGDWMRRKSPPKALMFVGVGEAIALPAVMLALVIHNYPLFLGLLFVWNSLSSIHNGPVYATLHSLMPSRTHATATAIYLFVVGGLGLALGPLVTGIVSDSISAGGTQASLQTALLILSIPKLWSVGHFLLAARSLRRHQRTVELAAAQPAPAPAP